MTSCLHVTRQLIETWGALIVGRAQLEQTSQHLLAVASVEAHMQTGCSLVYALDDAWQLLQCFAELDTDADYKSVALV